MSTKQETDTNIKFDPYGLSTYQGLQGPLKQVLLDAMLDPKKSSFFTSNWQMLQKANQGMLARSIANVGQNLSMRGISSTSPLYASEIAKAARASSSNTNNAYLQALQMASQRQMQATQMAEGYNPLQTGSHSVTTTSGLGTWLPQALAMGASFAMPFLAPATMGMAAGGAAMSGAGALGRAVQSTVSPVAAYNASTPYWFPAMPSYQR